MACGTGVRAWIGRKLHVTIQWFNERGPTHPDCFSARGALERLHDPQLCLEGGAAVEPHPQLLPQPPLQLLHLATKGKEQRLKVAICIQTEQVLQGGRERSVSGYTQLLLHIEQWGQLYTCTSPLEEKTSTAVVN